MPIIKTIQPQDATGELEKLYSAIKAMGRDVGNNAQMFSVSPELLRQQLDFIKFYMNHPTLSMPLLASIRIMVSTKEECQFCIDYNTAMLVNMCQWSLDQVLAMKQNTDDANLPERERAMLKFVLKSIRNAHSVHADDVALLYTMDWSDNDMLEAVNHGARMLATDIIFNTFKIKDYQ